MKPFIAAVHTFKICEAQAKCLLLRRYSKHLTGNYLLVTGKFHEEESAVAGALRELFEETGLRPDRFYTADILESFYLAELDIICHMPVFVAFIDQSQEIILSALMHIEEQFIKKTPNERFLLDLNEYVFKDLTL